MSGISIKKDTIFFDGQSIENIVRNYKTPLFVFSEKRIIDNYKLLEKSFQKYYKNFDIHYSVKTNFEPKILKTLREQGAKAEIASAMEYWIATKAGFKTEEFIVDGPAWTDEEITLFIKNGVQTLNVDSLDLLERVNNAATKLKRRMRISFRINPEIKKGYLKGFIENYIDKFGIPISKAPEAYKIALTMKYIEPVAISTHIGSMITDPAVYKKTIDKLVKLAAVLRDELDINIEEINLGGGFGVQSLNYYAIQNIILEKAGVSYYKKAASIEAFGEQLATKYKNNLVKYKLPNIKLVLEPGRFIVSDSAVLLTNVVAVKDKWIFIDGGINLIPESIFFIRRGFIAANKINNPQIKKYNIAGPTLNTVDILATNQKFPAIETGDTIMVLDAGAYSLTRSNQFTALRPSVVYVTKDNKITFLRKKEDISDLLDKLLI